MAWKSKATQKAYLDKRYADRRAIVTAYKAAHPCMCGEKRWWVLDFHHRDPGEKRINIGRQLACCSMADLLEEMEKCDVLCKNCHADLHHWEE